MIEKSTISKNERGAKPRNQACLREVTLPFMRRKDDWEKGMTSLRRSAQGNGKTLRCNIFVIGILLQQNKQTHKHI